jgi:hypothetical protein
MKSSAPPLLLQANFPDDCDIPASLKRKPAVKERAAIKQPFKLCWSSCPGEESQHPAIPVRQGLTSKVCNMPPDYAETPAPVKTRPRLHVTSTPPARQPFLETFQDRLSSPSSDTSSPEQSPQTHCLRQQGAKRPAPPVNVQVEQAAPGNWDGRRGPGTKLKGIMMTTRESPPRTRGRASRELACPNLQISQDKRQGTAHPAQGSGKRAQEALECRKTATKHRSKPSSVPGEATPSLYIVHYESKSVCSVILRVTHLPYFERRKKPYLTNPTCVH